MSGLTRDGTAEPVSRPKILRRKRGQKDIFSPFANYEQDSNHARLIHPPIFFVSHVSTVLYCTNRQ